MYSKSRQSILLYCLGGYYSLKTKTGMRVIGLNTNLYYTTNKQVGNPPYPDPADQFVWLEQTLQSARTNKEKVYEDRLVAVLLFACKCTLTLLT